MKRVTDLITGAQNKTAKEREEASKDTGLVSFETAFQQAVDKPAKTKSKPTKP